MLKKKLIIALCVGFSSICPASSSKKITQCLLSIAKNIEQDISHKTGHVVANMDTMAKNIEEDLSHKTDHVVANMATMIDRLPCNPLISISQADFEENSTYSITSPGQYCLASDITGIITVQNTTNVELILLGHTLILPAGGAVGITISNCSNVTVSSGIIQKNGTDLAPIGTGVLISASSINITLTDMHTVACQTGIQIADSNRVAVKNSLCESGVIGIACAAQNTNSYDLLISKTTALNNSTAGIQCIGGTQTTLNSIVITGCQILNNTLPANNITNYGISTEQVQGVTIKDTTINTATYAVAFDNTCDAAITRCKLLNAGQTGLQITTTSNGGSLSTLPQACELDHVTIDQCGYRSVDCTARALLKIKDCQLVESQDSALSIAQVVAAIIESSMLSNVLGSNAAIVQIGGTGAIPCDTVRINQCTISNWVSGNNLNGISVTNTSNLLIEHTTISPANATSGNGIILSGNNGQCVLRDCLITGNPGNGISIQNIPNSSANETIIDNCHIPKTVNNGITMNNTQNCIIKNSAIKDSTAAISITSGTNITIANNILTNCYMYGIYLDSGTSDCGVRDNTICGIRNKVNLNSTGIQNLGQNNAIYHNYAYNNSTDYSNVNLIAYPAPQIGAHDNLSSSS